MNAIEVTGMTVTQVAGCGLQKGQKHYYRGVPVEINLVPKVQVDIVVAKVPVQSVIDAAQKALYTGNYGDGKIFVYQVERVVKVRTGETDYAAFRATDPQNKQVGHPLFDWAGPGGRPPRGPARLFAEKLVSAGQRKMGMIQ